MNDTVSTAPDPATQFSVTDPATGEQILVREMTAPQLAAFIASVSHSSKSKLQAVLSRMQLILPVMDGSMLMNMFEQALTSSALLLVLQYEKNRRANLPVETTH